ncbi:hypothetical protein HK104_001478, partial [Borealophlyctis nickersoniae]
WDGLDTGEVMLAQEYGGEAEWRIHWDWLLPYFKHQRYIKVSGKPVFSIYNTRHMANHIEEMGNTMGPMVAKFKEWAVEAGFPGLHVAQVMWYQQEPREDVDAVLDFMPLAIGTEDHTKFLEIPRRHPQYWRGTFVCWDNTPRHPTDGRAWIGPRCDPDFFREHLIQMFKLIQSDPNRPEEENFFFINALNEWGEGNVLEPSKQFGSRFMEAVRDALMSVERGEEAGSKE